MVAQRSYNQKIKKIKSNSKEELVFHHHTVERKKNSIMINHCRHKTHLYICRIQFYIVKDIQRPKKKLSDMNSIVYNRRMLLIVKSQTAIELCEKQSLGRFNGFILCVF